MIFLHRNFLIVATLVVFFAAGKCARAAQSYVIVDSQTGYVLEAQKPRDKRQVGSLTKVATAMVVLDWAEKRGGDLNQMATIPPEAFVGDRRKPHRLSAGRYDHVARLALRRAGAIGQHRRLYPGESRRDRASIHRSGGIVRPSGTPVGIFVGQMNALAQATANGAHAFRQSARHRRQANDAVFDRRGHGASDSLCDEQGGLSFLRFAKGATDFLSTRRQDT